MLTKEKILMALERDSAKLRSFGVKKIFLVGSYARGKATDSSDIDFVVDFEEGRGLFDDYIKLLHYLEDVFKHPIDVGRVDQVREEFKPFLLGDKVEARI